MEVVVVVTPGCHLCEEAVATVAAVCDSLGVGWREVELSTLDDAHRREWRESVPVTLIDGRVHDIFRVTEQRLRSALLARPGGTET
jgi:glutaredoxin